MQQLKQLKAESDARIAEANVAKEREILILTE
jgi:hypothetical protein